MKKPDITKGNWLYVKDKALVYERSNGITSIIAEEVLSTNNGALIAAAPELAEYANCSFLFMSEGAFCNKNGIWSGEAAKTELLNMAKSALLKAGYAE